MPRHPGTILLISVLLLTSGAARAQSDEDRREAAKALVQQGTSLYGEGAYKEALKKFRAAYEVFPNPKIFFNIGLAAMKTGDDSGAANAFSSFLERTLDAGDIASQRSSAREHLATLSQHLGRIRVEVTPPDAAIAVDQTPVSGRSTFVSPGTHAVTVTAPGFNDYQTTLQVLAAEDHPVTVKLDPKGAAAVPPPADVPAAEPHRDVAPTLSPSPAPARTADLQAAQEPAPSSGSRSTFAWITAGGGAALLISSGVVGYLASVSNNQLQQLVAGNPPVGVHPTDAPGLRNQIGTESIVSTGLLVAGVAAAGVATYLFLSDQAPPPHAPDWEHP